MNTVAENWFVPRNGTLRTLAFLLLATNLLPTARAQFEQQGNKLAPSDAGLLASLGLSVAISANGNTAIFGGVGAAWVYTRAGGVWSEQVKLTAPADAVGNAEFGISVSLSADGNTAFIGGPSDSNDAGASWVFVRSGGVWTEQAKLTAQPESASTCSSCHGSGVTAAAYNPQTQGTSVSISSDGNTAIVGAKWDHYNRGGAWIYTRNGATWTQASGTLLASDATGQSYEGSSVAMSGDGATAIVGGDRQDGGMGAAWVYALSSGTWTQQGNKLQPNDGVGGQVDFGVSVALSADGNTALIGGDGDSYTLGAAWVFTRSEGAWTQQGSKLTGSDAAILSADVPEVFQGAAVALSADGNTAMVGGWGDGGRSHWGTGAAWEYTRLGGAWSQRGSKLVGTDADGSSNQGGAVAISGDGATLVSGGGNDNYFLGAAWVFIYVPPPLVQQGSKITGTDLTPANQPQFGAAVAISADGNTAIVGTGFASNVYVYTRSNGAWSLETEIIGAYQLGYSVGLSADGNTAVMGAPFDTATFYPYHSGAAYVYTRSNGVWSQQAKVFGTGAALGVSGQSVAEGSAVAISADGNTIAMGGPNDSGIGAVWVYTRSGSTWTQQGGKLQASEGPSGSQGWSVALSADGSTALVGDPNQNAYTGTAWVFTRDSSGNWTLQAQLAPAGAPTGDGLGTSVALSADGNTAIIGSSMFSSLGAYVFTRSNGAWSQQGGVFTAAGVSGSQSGLGAAVALSSDGNTALVGGPEDNTAVGACWMYTRTGGVWSQLGGKLVGTSTQAKYSCQGESAALSADGHTAIVGGECDNSDLGAAWMFSSWPSPAALRITAPASAAPGVAFQFGVTAVDSGGNPVGDYDGTVHFTSSDGAAGLPPDSTMSYGSGRFTGTLNTAGAQTITATDTAASALTGSSGSISVTAAGVATRLVVAAPASATVGASFSFTVTAVDAFNNTVTSYAHTIHFTSTDSAAVLPSDAALANGTGTFTATLETTGRQLLTATDTAASAVSGTAPGIAVNAAMPATHFVVSAASFVRTGAAFNFTVTAADTNGNAASAYTGTVHFTSSDSQATLAPNATLTSGVGTFPATLKTVGGQTITATDTVSSLTGVSGTITVCSKCDINLDGTMNVVDVQLEINEALGVTPAVNDLNGDGQVNVVDVQIVINAALGLGCAAS